MLFYRFLASYVLVLIIPLLVIGILIYGSIVNSMITYIENENINKLEQVKDYFDVRIDEIKTICSYLPNHVAFQKYSLSNNDILNKMNIIEILNDYNVNNNFIYEIFFYEKGQDYLYSSSSVYRLQDFAEKFYKYKDMSYEDFLDYISRIQRFTIRNEEEIDIFEYYSQRVMTFIAPIPNYSIDPYGVVIILVSSKVYEGFIQNILNYPEMSLVILDENNKPITIYNSDGYSLILEYEKLDSEMKDTTNIMLDYKGRSFLVTHISSDSLGWKYFLITPKKLIESRIKFIKTRFFYSLIIVLLISAFIIYLLMKLNYNPIKKISQFIREKVQNNQDSIKKMNELKYLQCAINEMIVQSNQINEKMASLKNSLKEVLLWNTIKGEIVNIKKFNEIGSRINITFTKIAFAVIVVSFESDSENSVEIKGKENVIIQVMERYLADKVEGYGVFEQKTKRIVMILALDTEDEKKLKEFLEKVLQKTEQEINIRLKCGVGTFMRGELDLQKSYIEACTAIEYKKLFNPNRIVLFSDVMKLNNTKLYSHEELKQLGKDIELGKANGILNFSREIINRLNSNYYSPGIYRHECEKLVIFSISKMKRNYSSFTQHMKNNLDPTVVYGLDSEVNLMKWIKEFFFDIVAVINLYNEDRKHELLKQIQDYVDNRCYDKNFSIQNLSEYLGLSISYISRYFKSNYGITLSNYIKKKRIEKAAILLESSNKNLQTIAEEIGYLDVSSFIRNFKKEKGITPGEYRNRCKI